MSKKGTYKVTASGNEGKVYITGFITEWDLDRFDLMVYNLIEKGIENASIYLDSFGGDAFSAQRIGNSISRFKGEVKCHVGLIAASSASYILAKCGHRTISANGQIMIHKPSINEGGNMDTVMANLKMLRAITRDFQKTYAIALNKTEADIEAMWKEDYWMDAEEALSLGFVHAIEEPVAEPDTEVVAELQRRGKWQAPVVTAHTTTQNIMSKLPLIIAALELEENSDEQAVLKATQALVSANKALNAKVQTLETQIEDGKRQRVTALVDDAIASNKITAAEKDRYTKLATADFENTAAILSEKQPHVSASSRVASSSKDAKYADWTYEGFMKNAPEVLASMKVEDPERYNQLRSNYITG
jgi:ATP-dependent Clp protease, protease subunit